MAFIQRLFKLVRKKDKKSKEIEHPKVKTKKEDLTKILAQFKHPEILDGLDGGQKRAVISDNPRTLVLAGAGAGKTKVLLHRILHLLKNKNVNSGNILAMTFTTDATKEMKDRLIAYFEPKYAKLITKKLREEDLKEVQKELKQKYLRSIWISTIHSLCYSILRIDGAKVFNTNFKVVGDEEKKKEKYKSGMTQQKIIKHLIDELTEKDPEFIELVKEFILDYLVDYRKVTRDKQILRKAKYITLDGKEVRSKSERDIANFLVQHKIRYFYEPKVDWINKDDPKKSYHPDFYLPDYGIYIEHWWVSSPKDKVPEIFKDFDKERYLKERKWKLQQFKKHKKILIESFESQMRGKLNEYYDYLYKEIYRETNGAVKIRHSNEFIETFHHLKPGLGLFVTGIMKIINLAKSNRMDTNKIKDNLKEEKHEEVLRFYDLLMPLYEAYEEFLEKKSLIDYNDMIHKVIKLFKDEPSVLAKYQKKFKHILVDEYQDVSAAQVELIKLLLTKENWLFAVGDDWQSIYGFRGSEVEFIVKFDKDFEGSTRIILPYNYRSGNDIVEASNIVIKKNPNQVDKEIKAYNSSDSEKIFQYNALNEIDGANFIMQKTKKLYSDGYKFQEVLLLYRRSRHWVPCSEYFKKKDFKIYKKTIHGSKGLESNVVFLVGLSCGSFPYVWEDSRIIQVIKKSDLIKKEEEERRVFYVAMTRAKEKLFLISEKNNESEFCTDIPDEFKIVQVSKSEFSEEMLSEFLKGVYSMVKEGMLVEEIAKAINKEERDVETYIAKLIEFGLLDVQKFVDKESYDIINKEIPKVRSGMKLYPIKRNLPQNITYGQIRYVIADLKSKCE